jgi:hypothetical protein
LPQAEDCLNNLVSNQIDIQSTLVAVDIRIHIHETHWKYQKLQKSSEKAQVETEDALMDGARGM